MKRMLFFVSLFSFLLSFSQEKKAAVKLAPLSLIDVINFPTLQLGLELPLLGKTSWYTEAGWRIAEGDKSGADTSFIATKGWKAKTEFRYYFLPIDKKAAPGPLLGYYAAANIFYIHDTHNAGNSYYLQKDTAAIRKDNFGVEKSVVGMNLLLGGQAAASRFLLIDFYAGLGLRYRNILTTHKEFDNARDELILPIDLTFDGIRNQAESNGGKTLLPNLTFGVRIGLLL